MADYDCQLLRRWPSPRGDGGRVRQAACLGQSSLSFLAFFFSRYERALCCVLALVFTAGISWLGGCNSGESDGSLADNLSHGSAEKSGNAASNGGRENSLVFEHDFGILAPKEQVEHRFVIKNDTSTKWTFKKVINTCSCTVSHLSAPLIEPGKEESVTVTYKAGGVTQDDKRRVGVLFQEAEAPRVMLVVLARVREFMTCVPPELEFIDLGKGKASQTNFEVRNFSDRDWNSISLQPSVDWLAASSIPLGIDTIATEEGLRQVWRITVTADASIMSTGDQQGYIEVTAEGTEKLASKVPVHGLVVSPVVAIPQQFFFGNVTLGESISRSITLRFCPDAVPESQERISLQHSLAEQLQLEWLRTEGRSWELNATFTPDTSRQVSGQKVTISFSDPDLPSLMLPVYASVEDK